MKSILVVVGLLMPWAVAMADTVGCLDTDCQAAFQALPSNMGVLGSTYWDNPSLDGPDKNIGFWLTGTGGPGQGNVGSGFGADATSPHTPATWYGNSNGSAAQGIEFVPDGSATIATVSYALSYWTPYTEFGWYDIASGAKTVLFNGASLTASVAGTAVGATAIFTPTAAYGFYLAVNGVYAGGTYQATWYSQSADNDFAGPQEQHFAVFQTSAAPGHEQYYVGVEDSYTGPGAYEVNGDFNDFVVNLSQPGFLAPAPEPPSLTFAGLGLAGLAAADCLRRRAAARCNRQNR